MTSVSGAQEDAAGNTSIPAKASLLGPVFTIWGDENELPTTPVIAYNSLRDEYLVVWTLSSNSGTTEDIYARRVRGDGTPLSSFPVTNNPSLNNEEPDVTYNNLRDEYLVVYTHDSDGANSDIWARRITGDGAGLDQPAYQAFRVGRPDASGKQHRPAVTYNENLDEFLVVYQNSWSTLHDIDAVRVKASDGSLPGWRNIASGAGEFRNSPDVAHHTSNNSYLIAYSYQPSDLTDTDIFARVASSNLNSLSPEIDVSDSWYFEGGVSVQATANDYLVIFESLVWCSWYETAQVLAQRVANDGTLLGHFRISPYCDTLAFQPRDEQSALGYGRPYGGLVVWVRGADVYGKLLGAGQDFAVNEFELFTVGLPSRPAVACSPKGSCLVAVKNWSGVTSYRIEGQLVMDPLFSDGFESGNTLEWSSQTP